MCENKKEWEKDECLLTCDGRILQETKHGFLAYIPNHIVEFYTGLKDKNGKKIFKGDIVQTKSHSAGGGDNVWVDVKAEVIFKYNKWFFKEIWKSIDRPTNVIRPVYYKKIQDRLEIVGHIHEL